MLYHRRLLENVPCEPLENWAKVVKGATRFISALTVKSPIFDAEALGIPAYDLGAPRNISGENVRDLDALRGDYLARTGATETILSLADAVYAEITRE